MMRPRSVKVIAMMLILVVGVGAAFGLDIVSGGLITDGIEIGPAFYDLLDPIPTK
jgi:hypothetical protein